MKKFIPILILLLPCFSWSKDMTIEEFLKTANSDYSIVNHREVTNYIVNSPKSTPYIDSVEIRTETDEFDIAKQNYSLRVYPKGWGETSATNLLTDNIIRSNKIENELIFNKAIKKRYHLVIELVYLQQTLEKSNTLLLGYNDKIKVLQQSANTLDFSINDLIKAEDDYTALQLLIVKLKNKITGVKRSIDMCAGKNISIIHDPDEIIRVGSIKKLIENINFNPAEDNLYFRDSRLKIEIAKNKYNLEVAANRDYLKFFEVEYNTEAWDEPRNAFSVGLAFKLPFINEDRLDIDRRKMDYLDEKLKHDELKQLMAQDIISISSSLKRFIEQHRILIERKNNCNATASFKKYMEMEGINPIALLSINESILKSDIRLIETEYDIRYEYIKLIDALGKLSERPIRNYFSEKLENIME